MVLQDLLDVPAPGAIPVIDLPALVLMKLDAGRPQDMADIEAILDTGADSGEIGAFLALNAPELGDRFAELLDKRAGLLLDPDQADCE